MGGCLLPGILLPSQRSLIWCAVADCPSRPNIPVNVLVGLEYLKAGNGWTDEEMYDAFTYDVQVDTPWGIANLVKAISTCALYVVRPNGTSGAIC